MSFDLGSIFASIGVNTAALDKGLMSAELKLAQTDKSISTMGQKLTASSTKMMVAGGIMAGAVLAIGVAAIKAASEFETSMRNVNSISKLSEGEFKALGESVIGISKKFPQTAKELADGLYDIASSGFQGAAGLKVLEASASAASAGLTNTATSAKGIAAVLNAYSLSADDAAGVSDTMFRTVDKGVISFEELSSQIGEVVGTANIAGIGFNELSGMIAYMTTKGIDAAEATTALNRMMLSIITPTEELAAVLKDAGYESGQMAIEQIGLTGVMELIEKAANGDVAAINAMAGDMRAFKAVASLTGSGIEELNNFMKDFKDTTGATAIALAEQSKALSFQLDILKNNATAMAIEFGNKLIPSIAGVVKKLNDLKPETKDAIYNFSEIALETIGAVGGLLLVAGAVGKVRGAVILLNGSLVPLIAGSTALAGIGTGLQTFFSGIGGAGTAAIGDFIDKTGLFKTAAGDMGHIVNDMKGVLLGNRVNATESGNIIEAAALSVQNYAIALSAASLETQAAATALFQSFKDGTIDINGLNQGLAELVTTTGNTSDATNKLTENVNAAIPSTNLFTEAQKETAIAVGETTTANNEEVKSIDDMRGAYNKLIATLSDGINANNNLQEAQWAVDDATKAVTEAIKKYGAGSREAEEAQNNLDRANQTVVDSFYEVYSSLSTTEEAQDAAKRSALEYGLQMVNTGQWGEGAFISLASQFGMSVADIKEFASDMDNKMDYVTRLRFMGLDITTLTNSSRTAQENIDSVHGATVIIDADINDVTSKIGHVSRMLSDINGTTATTYINTVSRKLYAMGGIVGMASGGVVMPQAASGMIVPQTGRAIPIIAHEYEDIVNTSQQRNLAEWIMGKANSRPDSKSSSSQEVTIHIMNNFDGKILHETWEKYDLREQARRV